MFSNVALDVFIGLVFVYLIYSLLATVIQEIIATRLAFRAKILEKAIIRMLEDGNSTTRFGLLDRINGLFSLLISVNMLIGREIAAWFYVHPLIKYLGEDNHYSKPAYITAQNFSKVMIDLLTGMGTSSTNQVQRINDSVQNGTIYQLPVSLNGDKSNPAIKALIKLQTIKRLDSGLPDPNATINLSTDTKL